MKKIILPTPLGLFDEGAQQVINAAKKVLARKPFFCLVLSGGETPKGLYRMLAQRPLELPWQRVHFFWGDERCVPPDHPDSNYRMARETLLVPLAIPDENIHRLRGETPHREQAALDYEEEIRRYFKLSKNASPPSFDLVLLGIGGDGHTASLFPEDTAWQRTDISNRLADRWVLPAEGKGCHRLTLTPRILNRARQIVFLASGEEKAQVMARVIDGPFTHPLLPAQQIHPTGDHLLWLIDRAAAKNLKMERS